MRSVYILTIKTVKPGIYDKLIALNNERCDGCRWYSKIMSRIEDRSGVIVDNKTINLIKDIRRNSDLTYNITM